MSIELKGYEKVLHPNILSQHQVAKLMGYERPGDAERKLINQGITPFYGRPGHWFITLDQLLAARGILKGGHTQDAELL